MYRKMLFLECSCTFLQENRLDFLISCSQEALSLIWPDSKIDHRDRTIEVFIVQSDGGQISLIKQIRCPVCRSNQTNCNPLCRLLQRSGVPDDQYGLSRVSDDPRGI